MMLNIMKLKFEANVLKKIVTLNYIKQIKKIIKNV